MNLNSTSLFHYTSSMEALINIIKNGFYPNYKIEKFMGHELYVKSVFENYGLDGKQLDIDEIAIPMVCFCDIRLSQISEHVDKYGNYGIGLTDRWKEKSEVSPVLYVDTRNSAIKHILNTLYLIILRHTAWLITKEMYLDSGFKNILESFILMSLYVKPVLGNKYNGEKHIFEGEKLDFFNEKEWRYIPSINHTIYEGKQKQYLIKKDINLIEEQNGSLKNNYKLKFRLSDLKYIIINDENDIDPIIKTIEELDESIQEKNKAITKIITMNQINEDF